MAGELMTEAEARSAVLAFVFSDGIGPADGKFLNFSLLKTSLTTFTWLIALEEPDGPPTSIHRYRVDVDRQSKKLSAPELVVLTEKELAIAVFEATGQHVVSSARFTDGSLSISYKVEVEEDPDVAYVVQLRHAGKVASMDALMTLISKTTPPHVLPIPAVYPIPGERKRQEETGMGRQIAQLIPGIVASSTYPRLPHEQKLKFVRDMALAFQACFRIQLPEPRLIGELIAEEIEDQIVLRIGPDRELKLGGPFASVRDYLRAHIGNSLRALEQSEGIDEYKNQFLDRLRHFIKNELHDIPAVVEDIPIVAMHTDMGPHNVIVSSETPSEIRAVIDWELVGSAPYASLLRIFEMLFRENAPNGFGPEYDRADELREAFWGAIPEWKKWEQSEATREFLQWFRFSMFLTPEYKPEDLPEDEDKAYWRENIRVVENMLNRYSSRR